MSSEIERIARGLTEAQRQAVIGAHWFHPGGHEPICLADFTDPWPPGVARFFTLKTDRLTPLGEQVRAHILKEQDRAER